MTQHHALPSDPQEDAVGRVAWTHLCIADIEDHRGEDPTDSVTRNNLRLALEAAYTEGHRAGYLQAIREGIAPEAREMIDPVYGTTGGGR